MRPLYLILFSILPAFIISQSAELNGIIVDINGEVIPGASIYSSDNKYTAVTSYDGSFSIAIPANKDIIFTISSVQFARKKILVNLQPNEVKKATITLKENELGVVEVIGDPDIDDPGIYINRWKPKNPEEISLPLPNIENMLAATQVGVTQNSELSAGYNVRGGNFDENLIYLNGIEIYRPFLARAGQQEGLSFINPYMVENVDFSAGGFSARYGDKLSSVMDVTYQTPNQLEGVAVTSFMGVSLFVQDTFNLTSGYSFGARYHANSYLFSGLDVSGDYRPIFIDVQGLYHKYFTEDLKFTAYGSYANNKYRVVPQNRETNWGSINEALRFTVFYEGQEITQFETGLGALSLDHSLKKDKLRLRYFVSAFRTIESEHFDLLGEYRLDELERDIGSDDFGEVAFNRGVGAFLEHARNDLDALVVNAYHKGLYNIKPKGKEFIEWGAKIQREWINDELSEWESLDSARFNVPYGKDSIGYTDPSAQDYQYLNLKYVLKAKNQMESYRTSGYFQWSKKVLKETRVTFKDTIFNDFQQLELTDTTFTAKKEFIFNAGVRGQYWSWNNEFIPSPRLSLSFKPALFFNHNHKIYRRNIVFRAAVGMYQQQPFYRAARNLNGELNPSIRAQKSIHFITGMEYIFYMWDRPFKWTTELYYKHLYDIIPYEIDNVRIRYYGENNAVGYAGGLDFNIHGEFVKGIESYASLSFLRTYEDIENDFFRYYFNSDGDTIIPGFTANNVAVDSATVEPDYIPRPTDQFMSFSVMFQDKMPEEWDTEKIKWSTFKVNLTMMFGSRLPYGPPGQERYKDTLRTSFYRRVDIGFSKDLIHDKTDRTKFRKKSLFRKVDKMWVALEVFNLLDIINVTNYNWITDVTGRQYSVPSTLTGRRVNLKFVVNF